MSSRLPDIYLARMDVDPNQLDYFTDWYDRKHAPDLVNAGFFSAAAYHCVVGGPLVCNVYEIESSEIFYTASYQEARTEQRDPERPRILAAVANRSNTAYAQLLTAGVAEPARPWSDGTREGRVEAPVITTVRFETPPDLDGAVIDWAGSVEFPPIAARPGFRAARLCRQAGRLHPANPSGEPRWMLFAEWDQRQDAEAGDSEAEAVARLAAAPFVATRVAYNLATLVSVFRDVDA